MKKLFLPLLLIITAVLVASLQAQEFTGQANPANGSANATTRAILNYLYQLPAQAQNRVISGQFGSYGDGTSYATAANQLQSVYNKTGQWPGVTGMDCATPVGMHEVVRFLTDKWNEGYLVNLSCHFTNPWTGGKATDIANRRSVRELITPDAPGNAAWMSILDNLAAHLQTLQSRGVVVMFRPLHENNGSWFWWGSQVPADYIALWRHMFDYFSNVKGLNNLLWVYSPNTADQWRAEATHTNYPGNDVVDIVSLDAYMAVNAASLELNSQGEYDFLVSTGKPFGLFEWGALPANGSGWDINPYPYRMDHLIRDIKARYPRMVLFQAWEYVWQMGRDPFHGLPELMNDSWVVARHELPNFRGGVIVQPTLMPTTTGLPPITGPSGNVVVNGAFDAGMAGWGSYGEMNIRMNSGAVEFYRNVGGSQAVVLQNTGRAFAANTGLEARVDLGNSSGTRKRVSILLHEGNFSDLQFCSFWLPPGAPMRSYVMRAAPTINWTQTHVAIYDSTANGQGWIRVDNVSLIPQGAAAATQTNCIDPLSVAPIGGSDGPNMIGNGTFSANQLAPWVQWGQVNQAVTEGSLSFYGLPGSPSGVMAQSTSMAVPANMPLEARFDLANTSSVRKKVTMLLHDNDFGDVLVCVFWLPPYAPFGRYVMRTRTTEAWANASISFYPSPPDGIGWIRLDNVSMNTRPGMSVNGTNCYEPGSGLSGAGVDELAAQAEVIVPTLEPTATPIGEGAPPVDLVIPPTLEPTVPPIEAPPEGLYSELPPPVTEAPAIPPAESEAPPAGG